MMFQGSFEAAKLPGKKGNGNNGKAEIKLLLTTDEGVPTLLTEKSDSNDATTMVKVKSCQKRPHTYSEDHQYVTWAVKLLVKGAFNNYVDQF